MCESEAEARRLSEAAEQRQRLERLALMSGGGSMITSKSLATGDDDEEALKRMNVILKVQFGVACLALSGGSSTKVFLSRSAVPPGQAHATHEFSSPSQ